MAEQSASSIFNNILNPSFSTGNVNVRDVAIGSLREVNSRETIPVPDIRYKLRGRIKELKLPVVSWMKHKPSIYDDMLHPACSKEINANIHDVALGSTTITSQPGAIVNVNSNGSFHDVNSKETLSTANIKDKLRYCYRKLELPDVSWMKGGDLPLENFYTPLQLTSSRWSGCKTDDMYNLENIFDRDDDNRVSRILIESQPGYGKTSLIHKIMDDWVKEKDYVRPFECAMMIILSHLKGRTIKEAVLDEINLKINDEQVWQLINSDKTLLLIDGLDEIGENDRQNVFETLYDIVGYKMTIIVTSRVGLFKLKDEERSSFFRGVAKSDRFWDKTVTILGFNDDNRRNFLNKFVKAENREKIMKIIGEFVESAEELFESPLMLKLLVLITRENAQYNIKTKTDLFKHFIDYIIKRSVNDKDIGRLEKNFTLFDRKTSSIFHDFFYKFGEMAIEHILSDNLKFNCNSLTDAIYRIGFLTKHKTKQKLEARRHYECFHMTILEFATAFALWNQFKKNGNKFAIQAVNKINELHLKKGATSMVIPFLCGLMETDEKKFFVQFAEYCALYSTDQDLVDLILNECTFSQELCGAVSKFIPPVYSCDNPQTVILANFNFYQKIVSLMISSRELWVLAGERNINVKSLMVYFVRDSRVENTDQYLRNDVKCDNLFVATRGEIQTYENVVTQFKLVLHCVSAKFRNIYISGNMRADFLSRCVDSSMFNNHTTDFLQFDFLSHFDFDGTSSETVREVIENITFKHLTVLFSKPWNSYYLNNNMPIVIDSRDITSLHMSNTGGTSHALTSDLSIPVKAEEKYWNCLAISKLDVVRTVPLTKNGCTKSLDICEDVSYCCEDVLFSLPLPLTELQCSIGMFQSILHNPNLCSWAGFESVVNLILTLDGQTAMTKISPCWDKFRNLEFVEIYFCGSVAEELQSEILNNLNLLKTARLLLSWVYSNDPSRIFFNVVSEIQNLVERNKLQLVKTIDFEILDPDDHGPTASQFDTLIELIISAVKCDSKITATFIFQRSLESYLMSRQLLSSIEFSNLKVQQITGEVSSLCHAQNFLFDYYVPFYSIVKLQRKKAA